MAEMKVYLPDDLDLKFRKTAMTVYGYGRGSLSKAATEALRAWCAGHERAESVPGKIPQKR